MVGVCEPPSSSRVMPKALATRPAGSCGRTTLALPWASGWKVPAGTGRLTVGGNQPQLVHLVGVKRLEVAGDEQKGSLVCDVGDLALRDRRFLAPGQGDACGGGVFQGVHQLPGCGGVCGEPRELRVVVGH